MPQFTCLHPEQAQDELFLGNACSESNSTSWKTNRYGNLVLMANGEQYVGKHASLRPWFIKRAEVESAIYREQLENKPWSPDRIKVYEDMLKHGGIIFK